MVPVLSSQPLPREALDLADSKQLDEALRLRQHPQRGILLFVFGDLPPRTLDKAEWTISDVREARLAAFWWLLTHNVILQLEGMGYDHYIALTESPEICEHLHASWKAPEIPPSCAYSSEPFTSHHYDHNVVNPGLWAMRYWVLTKIAERGVNVLLLDTDYEFNHDIYPILMSPPWLDYHVVALAESPVNGGTMFCRGSKAHPKGGSLWFLREVERRSSIFLDAQFNDPYRRDAGLVMDQEILGQALAVASWAHLNVSEWDWRGMYASSPFKSHSLWQQHPQDDEHLGPMRQDANFEQTDELYSLPNATCPVSDPDACGRFDAFLKKWKFVDTPIKFARICTPHDSPYYDATVPCEKLAMGPSWLWGTGDIARYGWNVTAAYHLLAIHKLWPENGGSSHSGRLAWLAVRGKIDRRLLRPPKEGEVIIQVQDEDWHASALYNRSAHTKHIVKTFVEHAASEKKVPALAPIPCNAHWIKRDDMSKWGVLDHRVIESLDGKCYPSPANYDLCFCTQQYMYDNMIDAAELRGSTGEGSPWLSLQEQELLFECSDFLKILE